MASSEIDITKVLHFILSSDKFQKNSLLELIIQKLIIASSQTNPFYSQNSDIYHAFINTDSKNKLLEIESSYTDCSDFSYLTNLESFKDAITNTPGIQNCTSMNLFSIDTYIVFTSFLISNNFSIDIYGKSEHKSINCTNYSIKIATIPCDYSPKIIYKYLINESSQEFLDFDHLRGFISKIFPILPPSIEIKINQVSIKNTLHSVKQYSMPVFPRPLKRGDKVCILELARMHDEKRLQTARDRIAKTREFLESRGLILVDDYSVFETTPLGLGDGTEASRANNFNKAVNDPEIKAIFALFGGYGSIHTLDKLDYESIRRNRPIFLGYSDETIAEIAMLQNSGLVTFHGPMFCSAYNFQQELTLNHCLDLFMNPQPSYELKNLDGSQFKVHKSGNCEGRISGGNLCLIVSGLGTDYEIDLTGKIFFFEEVLENAYKIHRMLYQLKLAGKFNDVVGIMIGSIINVQSEELDYLMNVIFDVIGDLDVPLVYNIQAGHIQNPITLPLGALARIENEKITILEPMLQE